MHCHSLLVLLGLGGSLNVWALKEAVVSQRWPQARQWGSGRVRALWTCSPCVMDLSREVLKGNMIPIERCSFKVVPWKCLGTSFGLLLESRVEQAFTFKAG